MAASIWTKLAQSKLEIFCIVQLGLGSMFMFTGFDTQGFIVESVLHSFSAKDPTRISPYAGYYGQSVMYAFYTVANIFSPLVIRYGSARWALFLGSCTFTLYQLGFLFLNSLYFYVSSALMGIGFAVFYAGHGVYLSEHSSRENIERNSALAWAVGCTCMFCGGVILLCIFFWTGTASHYEEGTVRLIYGAFTAMALLSNVTFLLLPSTRSHRPSTGAVTDKTDLFRLLATRDMLYLTVTFIYLGFVTSFWITILPTAIAFTEQLAKYSNYLVAFYAMAVGLGEIIIGLFIGFMSKRVADFGRNPTIFMGLVLHLVSFSLILVSMPKLSSLQPTGEPSLLIAPSGYVCVVCAFLLGLGDGCWNTARCAIVACCWKRNAAQAFSISKLFQALASCLAYYCSPMVHLHYQLLILSITVCLATLTFLAVSIFGNTPESVKSRKVSRLSIAQVTVNDDHHDHDHDHDHGHTKIKTIN